MANYDVSWVPGAHVRFGSLDFIITVGGELVRANTAIRSLPSTALNHKRLGRQLDVSLGSQQSRKNQRRLAPSSDNDVARPSATPRQPLATSWHCAWFKLLRTTSLWG